MLFNTIYILKMKCILQHHLFIIIIITSLTQVFTYKVGSSTKWTDYRTKTHFDFSSLVRPEE
jgi:hypothetical protein